MTLNGKSQLTMKKYIRRSFLVILMFSAVTSLSLADEYLESLRQDQKLCGFTVKTVYENANGKAMGARFLSDTYGFVLDVIQVESVPQSLIWVKSKATTSMGRPHACEHLLLGKGNRGRYLRAQADMTLSNISAGTAQTRTYYHFNTVAGTDVFFEIFEATLFAMINPDFTDEEIRREVCHIGVVEVPETGKLSVDEKGTVYTEMVSSYEKPWYYYGEIMDKMVYGENHPLSNSSGGDPDVMRDMVPADMWEFIKSNYHLSNMGAIVSIPSSIHFDILLQNVSDILSRCQSYEDTSKFTGIMAFDFPPQKPAPLGAVKKTTFPSDKITDPGFMVFAWLASFKLDTTDDFMADLFWETFSSGSTSNLYKLFINSETRKIDLGAQSVYGYINADQGSSPSIWINNVDNKHIDKSMLDSVRSLIMSELGHIHDFENDSEALLTFNREVMSRLLQKQKASEDYLNTPPRFGSRSGVCYGWLDRLGDLEKESGFRKSLTRKDHFNLAKKLISSGTNIWRPLIEKLEVLESKPYAVGSGPSPDMLVKARKDKERRISEYLEDLKKKYGTEDEQQAIMMYKKDFDAKTAELEAIAANQKLPNFIENPPMSLDEQLQYETIELNENVPLFVATFENMSSSTVFLYLRMDVIPESHLVYTPLIPTVLTDIGVHKDGKTIGYDKMKELLRREVYYLYSWYDHGYYSGRTELCLSGKAANLAELRNVIAWMDASLYSPYLSIENISRIKDVIDQKIRAYRSRTKAREENWVRDPAEAYRLQDDPLFLSTDCFLTELHHMLRLKFQMMDPGDKITQKAFSVFIDTLAEIENSSRREELVEILNTLQNIEKATDDITLGGKKFCCAEMSPLLKSMLKEVITELLNTLPEIPDANLENDWQYLCKMAKHDVLLKPEIALANIKTVLDMLRKTDIARMVIVSNSDDRNSALDLLQKFTDKLDSKNQSIKCEYVKNNRIIERLKSREEQLNENPVYVGLIHESTRNGTLIFSAKLSGKYDTDQSSVLNCLTGKLYSGAGPHGFYMNTWAAGLAYGNGSSYNQGSGRISYYAERCPDVSETMRFVVNLIKNASAKPDLIDYAMAQVFRNSRAQSAYESRGNSMAADYVDGLPPEKERAFREAVLKAREDKSLLDKLIERLDDVYGPVLVGFGKPLSESRNGVFFLVGPERQFGVMEKYIEAAESKQIVYRLYPRDYWLPSKQDEARP